ncbi:MAG TPA: T9SS type A sorting domain-containing protein, partial [Bacteroidales bacterium]|nr:T9SS type A sorting domain-containing protein [Bacteroidales bacterium]
IWQDIPGAVGTSLLANPPYTRSYRVWVTSNGLNCNAIISNIATLEVVDPLTKAPIEDVNMPDESEQTPEPNTEVLASMNLYPNPFRNELNIYLEDCSAGPVVIEVYNLTGSLIYRLDLETETDSFFWQMDISDWAPSIYMFRIENGNQVMVKRAVKN